MDIGFEAKVGVVRVLLPVLLGVLAVWLTLRTRGVGVFFGGALFVFGLAISEFANSSASGPIGWLREILVSSPKEPWMRMLWVFPVVFLVSRFLFPWCFGVIWRNRFKSLSPQPESLGSKVIGQGGILAAIGAIAVFAMAVYAMAYILFPRGAGYEDKASMIFWSPWLILAATSINGFAVSCSLHKNGGGRFLWTLVVQFGCIAVCILQGYASLGEWALVLASLGGVTALIATMIGAREDSRSGHPLISHVHALGFASLAFLSVSQVYSWSPLPIWFLLLLCFLPTVHVLLDLLIAMVFPNSLSAFRIVWWLATLAAFLGAFYWVVLYSVPQW